MRARALTELPRSNQVALTFDDGPDPLFTAAVLEVLEDLRAPASFFVVGRLAAQHPDLIERQLAAGMAVGNHSLDHPLTPPFGELPGREIRRQIADSAALLASLGAPTRLFRPPGRKRPTRRLLRNAIRTDAVLVSWSVDPADWRPGVTADEVRTLVLRDVRGGSIVLLHDGGGDRSATVAAVPGIVRGVRALGLELVALDPGANDAGRPPTLDQARATKDG